MRGGRRSGGAKEDGVAATTWSLEMEKEQNSSVVGESRRAAAVGIQRGGEGQQGRRPGASKEQQLRSERERERAARFRFREVQQQI